MLAGYKHLLQIAAARRWDERDLPLDQDAAAWPALAPDLRERLLRFLAGFCLGESAVAGELAPFAAAAANPDAARCFAAQQADEARHARFFDRYAAEVAGVPGDSAAERRSVLRAHVPEEFIELFEVRLPATARSLAGDPEGLAPAVGLYHMVLEGVVFTAGQLALLEWLQDRDDLPALREGMALVVGDERWHIGFGARSLHDLDPPPGAVESILADGERAARAWGDLLDPDRTAHVVSIHRRRLRAAGLTAAAPV